MSPAVILAIVQGLLIYGPPTALAIHNLLTKDKVTSDEIKDLISIAQKDYDTYIKEAKERALK